VHALLFDVEETEAVGVVFPEGSFAEGAVELEPWLGEVLVIDIVVVKHDELMCAALGCKHF
jgi:hypothetical protein